VSDPTTDPERRTILSRTVVSKPGAVIQVTRLEVSDDYRNRIAEALKAGRDSR
jgi:hypothetical protein